MRREDGSLPLSCGIVEVEGKSLGWRETQEWCVMHTLVKGGRVDSAIRWNVVTVREERRG